MSPGRMRGLLGLALLASVAAAWFAPPDVPAAPVGAGAVRNASVRPAQAASAPIDVLAIRDRGDEEEEPDGRLFAPALWAVAAAPAAAPAPEPEAAAPAQAPPLPFRVLGQSEEGGRTVVFLQHGELNLLVRVGDTIADQYKVESLQGGSMNLRYIPLNQIQTLELGGR